MDLQAIRTGIVATLKPLDGLTVYKSVPGSINAPAVVIHSGDDFITYHETMGKNLCSIRLDLTVLVARVDDARALEALDGYLSSGTGVTRSLIDALDADPTLGGSVDTFVVESANGPFINTDGGANLAAATLSLTLYASRK